MTSHPTTPARVCRHGGDGRPPAIMVHTCRCGRNYHCPVCGRGAAMWPCPCVPAYQAGGTVESAWGPRR